MAPAIATTGIRMSARLAATRNRVTPMTKLAAMTSQVTQRGAAAAQEHEVLQQLADAVAGRGANTYRMNLETFVLAAELEEIVAAANDRLAEMSSGRYTLHHSDARAARGRASGLGIDVLDAHTGRLRSPQSLSGGETFIAALALALGLADVVESASGKVRLDTVFIDEGFGSLDAENGAGTLDLVLRVLSNLTSVNRAVGLISHVPLVQEAIPHGFYVMKSGAGSTIETRRRI